MRISVIGLPKTGTTALYNLIKSNTPTADCFCLFEPSSKAELKGALGLGKEYLIIKFMIHKLGRCGFKFNNFDKNILIVRDPRDFIVSALLYRFNNNNIAYDKARFEELVIEFQKKEENPESISCVELFSIFNKGAPDLIRKNIYQMLDEAVKISEKKSVFTFKYEEMIDKNVEDLEKFLGITLKNWPEPQGWTSKIARSRGYGDWKNWFTNRDIAFFGECINGFLEKWNYDVTWELNKVRKISPDSCTKYIFKLTERVKNDPLYKESKLSKEYIEGLYSAAEDGKNVAMYKLGLIYLEGNEFVPKNKSMAIHFLNISSKLGNHKATVELAENFSSSENEEDLSMARSIFRRGALDGDKNCLRGLIKVLEKVNDENKVKFWKSHLKSE